MLDAQQFHDSGFICVSQWLEKNGLTKLKHFFESAALDVARDEGVLTDEMRQSPLSILELLQEQCPQVARAVRRKLIIQAGYTPPDFILGAWAPQLAVLLGVSAVELSLSLVSVNSPSGALVPDGVTGWHQDFQGAGRLGIWVPLMDSTPENGCLRFIPRMTDPLPHRRLPADPRDLALIEDDDLVGVPVDAPCPAGGAVLFDTMTPHSTHPNVTATSRWALVVWVRPIEEPVA